MKEATREIAAGVDEAEEDFDARKYIVEMLNVSAKLMIENDEKVAYVTCVFKIKPERLLIASPGINSLARMQARCMGSMICWMS